MRKCLLMLGLAGGYAAPLLAQTLDSVRVSSIPDTAVIAFTRDSVRSYFTKTVAKTDTVTVAAPLPSGVDTLTLTDTLRLSFWHTGKIIDSTKQVIVAPVITMSKGYGPSDLLSAPSTAPFTGAGAQSSTSPQALLNNIAKARTAGVHFIATLPCGAHSATNPGNCLSLKNGVYVFDRTKFDASMALYNTTEIRAALAKAYADGVVLGVNIMDEPNVSGLGDGNTWGPAGTMTKLRVDSLCRVAKSIWPTVPVGPAHTWAAFEPTKNYAVCDHYISQYSYRLGSVSAWRDSAMVYAARQHMKIIFAANILNGGTQDKDGTWDCGGGVMGQYSPNCAMTPTQIIEVATVLGDAGCGGFLMWRYDDVQFALPAWKSAFLSAAAIQAKRAWKPCVVR